VSRADAVVLAGCLLLVVLVGLWKGRGNRDAKGYLLAGRDARWFTICLSIMATQASAITFLSTPGQAYADGMRFVQFYLGLPLAMVVLSVTVVPLFHRLKVFTAYEFLEQRFDLKTRELAAFLFLVQRGLAVGLTIYAPALVLSVLLGWSIHINLVLVGALVMVYTVTGGTRAVSWAQSWQMLIITCGMGAAGFMVVHNLPRGVGLAGALHVAGSLGRLDTLDLRFDLHSRYTLWSGLIGGFFLSLSYFGTDQSQVQRYLSGSSVAQSRMGLLANGLFKVPMQFLILLLGALVFAACQFSAPPVFFNPAPVRRVLAGPHAEAFRRAEADYQAAAAERSERARALVAAHRQGADPGPARSALVAAEARTTAQRARAIGVLRQADPGMNPSDTNYIFLWYVLHSLPAGLVGLVLAAVFSASMSSMSAEINALGATTVVDVWRRFTGGGSDRREVWVSRAATFAWGCFAILFAEYASRLGSLVEAVNLLGSLFYGTILGIFLVAFYFKRIRGGCAFWAALLAEAGVLACFCFTGISFLWYNLVGCGLVVLLAALFQALGGPGSGTGSPGPMNSPQQEVP
jgi:solute:Na+ symporter, SSS family